MVVGPEDGGSEEGWHGSGEGSGAKDKDGDADMEFVMEESFSSMVENSEGYRGGKGDYSSVLAPSPMALGKNINLRLLW